MLVKIDKFNKNNTWVNPAHVESIEVYDAEQMAVNCLMKTVLLIFCG